MYLERMFDKQICTNLIDAGLNNLHQKLLVLLKAFPSTVTNIDLLDFNFDN